MSGMSLSRSGRTGQAVCAFLVLLCRLAEVLFETMEKTRGAVLGMHQCLFNHALRRRSSSRKHCISVHGGIIENEEIVFGATTALRHASR